MTEKELKKLNRYQLLELLVLQTERADHLQARLEDAEKQLRDFDIKMSELGSIADASLQLRKVFEAAQAAADTYIDAAKKQAEEIIQEAQKKGDEIISRAADEARRLKE
ncbi:MAG: DNA repair protein [Clostridia bacterium]|nr:DNA repair protein [Clostridia bacterium]